MPSFVDTNVLVYAEDSDAKDKQRLARDVVLQRWDLHDGVLSVQVLHEFYVTVTRKLKKPLAAGKARDIIDEYLTWTVVDNTGSILLAAIDIQRHSKLSFWDALVVQAAITAGCDRLYSEDLNAGQRFGDMVVVNPFAAAR
ncbi:MAG: PIN domain-containing protein [Polyangiaceae bacterium]